MALEEQAQALDLVMVKGRMHTGTPSTPHGLFEYKGSTPEDNGTIGGLRPVKMLLFGLASPLLLLTFARVCFCLERHEVGLRALLISALWWWRWW